MHGEDIVQTTTLNNSLLSVNWVEAHTIVVGICKAFTQDYCLMAMVTWSSKKICCSFGRAGSSPAIGTTILIRLGEVLAESFS